jgi:hypothetical protein
VNARQENSGHRGTVVSVNIKTRPVAIGGAATKIRTSDRFNVSELLAALMIQR